MLADLDLLLIAVFCVADDLLPRQAGNAKRMLTEAEVVSLCVAQAIMGIPSDERFLAVARKHLSHLLPRLPKRPGSHKHRQRLADTIEPLIAVLARDTPAFTTTSSWSIRPQSSVPVRSRRPDAASSQTPPTMATAPPTAASSGAFGCSACSRSTGTPRAPIRQRIESIFQTCKDLLTFERHGARICSRFLALAAAISLNHRLGRPPRALTDDTA